MVAAFIALGSFVVVVAVLSRLKPGKTAKDLVFTPDEHVLYECQDVNILRYPRWGAKPLWGSNAVSWPRSKIQITNKRIVFSQKGLLSSTYVIREIAVREGNSPESWEGVNHWWGLVPVYGYNKNDFSLATKGNKAVIIFKDHAAPNLARMEIFGVASVEAFMQALN